ncbi:MAG: hypothetical protein GY941_22765 [Planctomycetes bacterium]|nr:hypothetical protein [Planctomycetota bacterium]
MTDKTELMGRVASASGLTFNTTNMGDAPGTTYPSGDTTNWTGEDWATWWSEQEQEQGKETVGKNLARIAEIDRLIADYEQRRDAILTERDALTPRLEGLMKDPDKHVAEIYGIKTKLDELRKEYDDLTALINGLKAERATL